MTQYYIKTSLGYIKLYLQDSEVTIGCYGQRYNNGNRLYNDWHLLTIDQKLTIKQHYQTKYGKRTSYSKPDAFKVLTETQIYYLLTSKI
jgi:hypothetical protein